MLNLDIYTVKSRWKIFLFLASLLIGSGSLWYTGRLVDNLSREEKRKVELWAEANRLIASENQGGTDLNFLLKVVENNTTIPVILTDDKYNILYSRNFDSVEIKKASYLQHQLEELRNSSEPIQIKLGNDKKNYLYYKESLLLRKLSIYPYVQLTVILIFIVVSYLAFSASRKAEQNKVWVGLSRETAHQLGTPISSLMAWIELLKDKNEDNEVISELDKDIQRLHLITERFSKIGSKPVLVNLDVNLIISQVVEYMQKRIPGTVTLKFVAGDPVNVPVNSHLFSWVIENLIKNSLDAVSNIGLIEISVSEGNSHVFIDVKDSGKGILRKNVKRVFKPGFTTKSRGWGLGLSLVRRIVEEYHRGKISVLQTEVNKGTTFRIQIPRA